MSPLSDDRVPALPYERIPLTLNKHPQAVPETANNSLARPGPPRPRWAIASADLIEGLRGDRPGGSLTLLADVVAAADAELVCVVGPGVVGGAAESSVVHTAHDRSARPRAGLTFPAVGALDAVIAELRPTFAHRPRVVLTGAMDVLVGAALAAGRGQRRWGRTDLTLPPGR